MALQLKLKVEEAADALSFIFTDITGEYDGTTNPGGWGAPNLAPAGIAEANLLIRFHDEGIDDVFPLEVIGGSIATWTNGIEIFVHDLSNTVEDRFPDGIYDFRVQVISTTDDEYLSDSLVMGFCAIITGEVMKDSLAYRVSSKKTYREWLLERMRLLDNLRYSAETGNIQHFEDSLLTLQRLK